MTSYQQPVKQEVRTRLLTAAVTALTIERASSPLVRSEELREIVNFAAGKLQWPQVPTGFQESLQAELTAWEGFYTARVGTRQASELKVLYLCGPEPLNDLQILISLGVNPHNVWAVTSSAADLQAAVAELAAAQVTLKIHHGNLKDFFDAFPETFDVIYVDACGPFTGGKPNTLLPLLSIFAQQRLSPLAALITTFSEMPGDRAAGKRYVEMMTAYFRYRYRDLPREAHEAGVDPAESEHDPNFLRHFIQGNVDLMYSEFITKLLTELAGHWIPSCRALATDDLLKNYVAPKKQAKSSLAAATEAPPESLGMKEYMEQAGDLVLSPSSYPLLSFFEQLKEDEDPLASQLGNLKINGREVGTLLGYASLLDRVFEGHWDCLSEKMKLAVGQSWFDTGFPFSCDSPLPNLLINSLLGIYGRPWLANPAKSLRLSYQAKHNRMYCDMLLLDQCRYFFDWWPTVDLCPSRFKSPEFQVLARCMIDRMSWHNWQTDTHPFRGGAVACMGETSCSNGYEIGPRKLVEEEQESD